MMPPRTRLRSAWLGFTVLLGSMFVLASAATLQAQVLNDPRIAEFNPSPDHWAVLDNGQPAVLRYELDVYPVGGSAPFGTLDMGKPSPQGDGKIRYDFAAQIASLSLPGGNYEARVSAVGPEGEALSDPSNPFTFSGVGSCAVYLGATTVQAAAGGGSYAVTVATGAGCTWTATNTLPWVTVWTGSGTGNGTFSFEVSANASLSGRSGTITVGDLSLTVAQPGFTPPCSYGVSPASANAGASGGGASFGVTAGSMCSWTATPSASWITVTAGGNGTGNGTVSVSLAANASTSARTGTVTVQGRTFTVTQAGAVAPDCSYSVTPPSFTFTSAGGRGTVSVVTSGVCRWTVVSDQSWLAPAVTGGAGNGTVAFVVKLNKAASVRTAKLTIGPWVVAVQQAGKPRRTK